MNEARMLHAAQHGRLELAFAAPFVVVKLPAVRPPYIYSAYLADEYYVLVIHA
jgi:hypothetical protein